MGGTRIGEHMCVDAGLCALCIDTCTQSCTRTLKVQVRPSNCCEYLVSQSCHAYHGGIDETWRVRYPHTNIHVHVFVHPHNSTHAATHTYKHTYIHVHVLVHPCHARTRALCRKPCSSIDWPKSGTVGGESVPVGRYGVVQVRVYVHMHMHARHYLDLNHTQPLHTKHVPPPYPPGHMPCPRPTKHTPDTHPAHGPRGSPPQAPPPAGAPRRA